MIEKNAATYTKANFNAQFKVIQWDLPEGEKL